MANLYCHDTDRYNKMMTTMSLSCIMDYTLSQRARKYEVTHICT